MMRTIFIGFVTIVARGNLFVGSKIRFVKLEKTCLGTLATVLVPRYAGISGRRRRSGASRRSRRVFSVLRVSVVAGRRGCRVSNKLYVGNLSFGTTSEDLIALFGQYGPVTSAQIVMDRDTGRSRGFAFVEMGSGAEQAIEAINDAEYQGRRLTVNEARPREERPRGGGGGGGYGGGGGSYGGGGGGGGYGGDSGGGNRRY